MPLTNEAASRAKDAQALFAQVNQVFLYLDGADAVHPIHVPARSEEPETYPVGV